MDWVEFDMDSRDALLNIVLNVVGMYLALACGLALSPVTAGVK